MWAPGSTPGSPLAPASYAATSPYVATNDGFATPANTLTDPFPSGLIQPLGKSQGDLTGIGQSVTVWAPFSKSPRIHQLSFDIQHELPGNIAVSIGYLGTRGRHLTGSTAGLDINQNVLDPRYFSQGSALNQAVPNPFFGKGEPGVIGGGDRAGVPAAPAAYAVRQRRLHEYRFRPIPRMTDSLIIKGQKRFSKGLSCSLDVHVGEEL